MIEQGLSIKDDKLIIDIWHTDGGIYYLDFTECHLSFICENCKRPIKPVNIDKFNRVWIKECLCRKGTNKNENI